MEKTPVFYSQLKCFFKANNFPAKTERRGSMCHNLDQKKVSLKNAGIKAYLKVT